MKLLQNNIQPLNERVVLLIVQLLLYQALCRATDNARVINHTGVPLQILNCKQRKNTADNQRHTQNKNNGCKPDLF